MLIALHKNARTTPAVRAEIAASNEPANVLALRFGITEQTVYKWKKRDVFADRSHTAHHLQTVLTPAQETVVLHLRRTLLLPLDDLLAVTREFICPHVSRSGLDRCLRRHGAGNLNALKPQEPAVAHKAFKSYEPGYVHMDVKYLPQMQDESSRRYLFVAIDRATRWVFVQLKTNKTAASAQAFLKALHKACPLRITKLLTDNGKEFTDRLFASREREPSGNHEFDQLCQELGIEHRLTKPRTPRTNGMVERFNGRIADVLKTHRFNSREDMEQTLLRYVALYNHQLPQSALKSSTPMQAMKQWYQSHPHLFNKRPYDRPGCDTYASKKASTLALGALTPVPSYAEGVRLLKAGQIDTLVADELLIPKDAAIALRPEQLTVEPYALVMRKGDAAFVDAVDKALHKILGGAQGKQLAQDAGLKVDHLTRDAWQSPNKQPAPPVL